MYDTILVPTDGSDHATRAAEHARYLARLFDATVHVISVVDVRSAERIVDGVGEGEFVAHLEADAKKAVEAVEALVGERDSVQTAVIRGEPAQSILKYADEHDADLLVMGTHGRTGLTRYIAGSVTERVLRLAEIPVLTTHVTEPEEVEIDYDELLVPTDGSEAATEAIGHGLAIAEKSNARVHAVNIVDVIDVAMEPSYTPPTELIEQLESKGEAATEEIATRARDAGLDAVTEVHEGFPARDLLDYADEHEIDLIVMGTAGRTGLNRFLLGSTTERVIRHAEMPVLAINTRDRTE